MSFDATLPTDRDTVRALLGDTSGSGATELVTDAYIDALLLLYSVTDTVAFIATGLAVRYAQQPTDITMPSGVRISWGKRIASWESLAAQMRAGGSSGAAFSVRLARSDGYTALESELSGS